MFLEPCYKKFEACLVFNPLNQIDIIIRIITDTIAHKIHKAPLRLPTFKGKTFFVAISLMLMAPFRIFHHNSVSLKILAAAVKLLHTVIFAWLSGSIYEIWFDLPYRLDVFLS